MATYDVRAFQDDGEQTLFDAAGGAVVTGPVMLGQRVFVELLTDVGTLAYLPFRGTSFLPLLRIAHSTELDVFAAFATALSELTTNLQREEASTDPDTERFLTASISNILILPGALQLSLTVVARSGGASIIELPLLVFDA
jgi:hypothetical protein